MPHVYENVKSRYNHEDVFKHEALHALKKTYERGVRKVEEIIFEEVTYDGDGYKGEKSGEWYKATAYMTGEKVPGSEAETSVGLGKRTFRLFTDLHGGGIKEEKKAPQKISPAKVKAKNGASRR